MISGELWFILIDIFMILCTTLIIILAILSLFKIILNKQTHHTISMMLVANSCLSALIVGCATFGMAVFTLRNDLKQIAYQDSFCTIRAYMGYSSYCALNYSFFLQALYRYIIAVYPNFLLWQSGRTQILAICLIWICAFSYSAPFLITNAIIYNVDNHICQLPLELSFFIIYGAIFAYGIPISLIIFIYLKLVVYVKQIDGNASPSNTLIRAQRQLRMVRRIVILIITLLLVCFPYTLIMFMSFFTTPPKYHFRIAYIFVDSSVLAVMISLFQLTNPFQPSLRKRSTVQSNAILSRAT